MGWLARVNPKLGKAHLVGVRYNWEAARQPIIRSRSFGVLLGSFRFTGFYPEGRVFLLTDTRRIHCDLNGHPDFGLIPVLIFGGLLIF